MKLVTLPETSLERFLENRFQSLLLMTEKTMGCSLLSNQEFEIFCQVAISNLYILYIKQTLPMLSKFVSIVSIYYTFLVFDSKPMTS